MLKTLLKTASLAAASTILLTGIAIADPNRYPYLPDTEPLPASKAQPITGPKAGPQMEYPDTEPQAASRYQRVAHEKPFVATDEVGGAEQILPPPMRLR